LTGLRKKYWKSLSPNQAPIPITEIITKLLITKGSETTIPDFTAGKATNHSHFPALTKLNPTLIAIGFQRGKVVMANLPVLKMVKKTSAQVQEFIVTELVLEEVSFNCSVVVSSVSGCFCSSVTNSGLI
jgi:hypothetical protein